MPISLKRVKEYREINKVIEYNIKRGMRNIGVIVISCNKENKCINVDKLFINKEYRGSSYGEKAIVQLCQCYPDSIIRGEIFYDGPINFWSKFDKSLKDLKSPQDRISFINMYGLFEFRAKDIINE